MDVKGLELVQLVKFVKERLGEDGYERWLESLPEETRIFYTRPIMQSMWYPVDTAFLPAFDRIFDIVSPDDPLAGGRDFGRFTGRDQLGGIYRVFLKMGSPNKMVSIASLMWGKFYNQGSLEVIDNEPGMARIRLPGTQVMSEAWEHSVAGWATAALEMAGADAPSVTVEHSRMRGDDYTQYWMTWE